MLWLKNYSFLATFAYYWVCLVAHQEMCCNEFSLWGCGERGPGVLLGVAALPLWEHYKGLANAINGTTKWCKTLTSG